MHIRENVHDEQRKRKREIERWRKRKKFNLET
jgi:hypothetical protein